MIDVGSQVYVRWYGSVLQGEVVPNSTPNDRLLGSMVAVRIPLQGSQAIALFTPGHVYTSVDQMQQVAKQTYSYPVHFPKPEEIVHPEPQVNVGATIGAAIYRQRYEKFKQEHWNHERNHMQVEYLEEGYQLYRAMIDEEIKAKQPATVSVGSPTVKRISISHLTAIMKHVATSGVPSRKKPISTQLSLDF